MVHQYKLNGYNIVLDTCSGGIHVVDDIAYDIISVFEKKDKNTVISEMTEKYVNNDDIKENDIVECYEQVEYLKNFWNWFRDTRTIL